MHERRGKCKVVQLSQVSMYIVTERKGEKGRFCGGGRKGWKVVFDGEGETKERGLVQEEGD